MRRRKPLAFRFDSTNNGIMAITRTELDVFQQFAEAKLAQGGADSMEQLFDLWLLEHPSTNQATEDLESIERGIADADAGRVKPSSQAFADIRSKLASEI